MGKALSPNFQEIVTRCITNKPNTLRLIDQIKADHQEQRCKLKNRIAPSAPWTSEWLDLGTRNKPAMDQWNKSIVQTIPNNQTAKGITWNTNPYSVLDINKMKDNDEQEANILVT